MPEGRVVCRSVVVVVLLAAVGSRLGAQERGGFDPDVERSRAIQAALAHIEANRAEFVRELLMAWTSYVDPARYDLFATLGPVAMRAPAWQLYGASLVGDFPTMVRVLRGEEGAGAHVAALSERPAPLTAYDPHDIVTPDIFASSTDSDLVYTPIPPCRLVDTRTPGGTRTGMLAAGASRSFDLNQEGRFSGNQGVPTSFCTGLPFEAQAAWAVNVTVTSYTGIGGLKAWGFGAPEPDASVINFAPGSSSLANGLILTGCYGCADDITVRAFGSATHVLIDVVGFFRRAIVFGSAVTRFVGPTVSVPAGGRQWVDSGACPAGTRLMAGEAWLSGLDVTVGEDRQLNDTTWRYWVVNNDAVARNFWVYARCLDVPVRPGS